MAEGIEKNNSGLESGEGVSEQFAQQLTILSGFAAFAPDRLREVVDELGSIIARHGE